MHARIWAPILVASTVACADDVHLFYHFTYREVDAVTHLPVPNANGIIEPGEAALVSLSVSFTPPVGHAVTNPPPPPPGDWTVHALGGVIFTLAPWDFSSTAGAWTNQQLAPGWNGWPGSTNSFGQVSNINVEQPAEGADTRNPFPDIWSGVWTPAEYTERVATFYVAAEHHLGIFGSVWLDYSGPPPRYRLLLIELTSWIWLRIPVSPGPPPCYANCDASSTAPSLNVDDFTCFINEFAAGLGLPHEQQIEHYANCDASTTPPVLSIDDFVCFINAFATGCP